ncbi:hypothetical protein Ddc_24367 [Ditylenchus destructor]|nr:hypothetical protein Ddc_24367 [Ditylenchus destructor]
MRDSKGSPKAKVAYKVMPSNFGLGTPAQDTHLHEISTSKNRRNAIFWHRDLVHYGKNKKTRRFSADYRLESAGFLVFFRGWGASAALRPAQIFATGTSGSGNSRQNRSLSAGPVPIASSHREEAIGISHAPIRAATGKLGFGLDPPDIYPAK